jgi:hypothetical protein
MAASDVSERGLLMGGLQVLLLAVLSSLLLIKLYALGHELAREAGRTLRGGVGWGLLASALQVAWFPLLILLQNLGALLWPQRRLQLALGSWMLFALPLLLLAPPWGSWSHPYRVAYLLSCAAVAVALSYIGQRLLQACRIGRQCVRSNR